MQYKIALLLHIVSVLVLFIGIAGIVVGTYGMRRSTAMKQLIEWSWLATTTDKIMPFAAAGVILSGIYIAITSWGWRTAWIDVALVSFVLMVALGPLLIGPRLLHIKKDIKSISAMTELVPAHLRQQTSDPLLWMVLMIFTFMAFGVVFLMILKPNLLGSLLTIGTSLILSALCHLPLQRVRRSLDPAPSTIAE